MKEPQTQLETLGQILRDRRESLGWSREELAGRMPHSAAYIFLIEGARPRRGGRPSRPRRHTLIDWATALGLSEAETNEVLRLAHHQPLDSTADRRPSVRRTSRTMALRDQLIGQVHEVLTMAEQANQLDEVAEEVRSMLDTITARLEQVLEGRERLETEALTAQLDAVLTAARQTHQWDATVRHLEQALTSAISKLEDDTRRGDTR